MLLGVGRQLVFDGGDYAKHNLLIFSRLFRLILTCNCVLFRALGSGCGVGAGVGPDVCAGADVGVGRLSWCWC